MINGRFLIIIGTNVNISDLRGNRYLKYLRKESKGYERHDDKKVEIAERYYSSFYVSMLKSIPDSKKILSNLELLTRENCTPKIASTFLLLKQNFIYTNHADINHAHYSFKTGELYDVYDYDDIIDSDTLKLFKNKKDILVEISSLENSCFISRDLTVYFVFHNGKIYISDDLTTLKEYGESIYQIREDLNITADNIAKVMQDMLAKATLVYEKQEKPGFIPEATTSRLNSKSSDISYKEFLEKLQFTNLNPEARLVSLIMQQDIKEVKESHHYSSSPSETKDFFKGIVNNIEIEETQFQGNIIINKNNWNLQGDLTFYFSKATQEITILGLPIMDGINFLDNTIMQIILEQMKNVTELAQIKNVFISNKLLGLTYIDRGLRETFSGLRNSKHADSMSAVQMKMQNLYNNEEKRKKVLELAEKKKEQTRLGTINSNSSKYNEALDLMKEYGAVEYGRFKVFGEDEEEIIALNKRKPGFIGMRLRATKKYKSVILLKAPKKLHLTSEICHNSQLVVIPHGVETLENIDEAMYKALDSHRFCNAPCAFLVIPDTIDVNAFPFFKHTRYDGFYLISDNPSFIEKFKTARRNYNLTCQKGAHFNCPIIYVPDIYSNIYGHRCSHETIFKDNLNKIILDINNMVREKHEIECIRFFEKKEMPYIPSTISKRELEEFCRINNLVSDNNPHSYPESLLDLEDEITGFNEMNLYNMTDEELAQELLRLKSKLYIFYGNSINYKRKIGQDLNPAINPSVSHSDPRATTMVFVDEIKPESISLATGTNTISESEHADITRKLILSNMQKFDYETQQISILFERMNFITELLKKVKNNSTKGNSTFNF